ncbi:hypothetical protein [Bacillus sp. AFS041924]|uniref:hypothetical protein n=1 Tax=Bacillus sp. AFS041924 TaxID=2033503 RepID=UPI000BFDF17C|nr:hypothetical protein [Bacillus sp. AFS041924]PGS51668.1 hypothetical protein COC46_11175 [Bacillus sp. AFS041924]
MPGEDPDPPSIDKSKFYAKCKEIASLKQIKYEILSDLETDYKNFYAVKFFFLPKPVYAVINSAHPFVAFCLADEYGEFGNSFPLEFIDFEELEIEFTGYTIMKVSDLNKQFFLEDHEELRNIRTIKKQVEYWNPITIGDVIFNYWD